MPRPKESRVNNAIGKRIRDLLANSPMTAQQLMESLGASQPTVSRYLSELQSAGMITRIGFRDGHYVYSIDTPNPMPQVLLSNGDSHNYDHFWGYFIEHPEYETKAMQMVKRSGPIMMYPFLCIPQILSGTLPANALVNGQKQLQQMRLELLKFVGLIDAALDDPRLWNEESLKELATLSKYTTDELESLLRTAYPPKQEFIDPINATTDSSQETS